jgi:hypothetical protein
MIVKYIGTDSSVLTTDKSYEVIRKDNYSDYYVVIGDGGAETWDWCERFVSISEDRDKKINKLLCE